MEIKNIFIENKSARILGVVIIISILVLFYGIWTESRSGKMEIYIPKSGASVFLNEKRVAVTNKDNQTITLKRIRAGEYSIIVSIKGYYPWEKTLNVSTRQTVNLNPFLLKEAYDSVDKKADLSDTEKSEISSIFNINHLEKISFDGDGNIRIKNTGREIFAEWIGDEKKAPEYFCNDEQCNTTIPVFQSKDSLISEIDFYPMREDVVIFSIKDGVYAIEIDKIGIQNFQPIYVNNGVTFRINNDGQFFIKEGGSIFELIL